MPIFSSTEELMNESEIRAYAAGYNSATRLFKEIIDHWAEAAESHRDCNCAICRTLQDMAHGRFGSMEIPPGCRKTARALTLSARNRAYYG